MINIFEILQTCNPNTTLYTTPYGEVVFDGVDEEFQTINFHFQPDGDFIFNDSTDKFGRLVVTGECIIFPTKENKSWENIEIKDGKIVYGN